MILRRLSFLFALCLIGIFRLSAEETLPISLQTGISRLHEVTNLHVARGGRLLILETPDGFQRWDARSGYLLGPIYGPDGTPLAPATRLVISSDSNEWFFLSPESVFRLDSEKWEWIETIPLDGVTAAVALPDRSGLLLARSDRGRIWLHQHTFGATEPPKAVARFRGTDSSDEVPTFDRLEWLPSGNLRGVQGKRALEIEPERWRMVGNTELRSGQLRTSESVYSISTGNGERDWVSIEVYDAVTGERRQGVTFNYRNASNVFHFQPFWYPDASGQLVPWIPTTHGTRFLRYDESANQLVEDSLPWVDEWSSELQLKAFYWDAPRRTAYVLTAPRRFHFGQSARLFAWSNARQELVQQFGYTRFTPGNLVSIDNGLIQTKGRYLDFRGDQFRQFTEPDPNAVPLRPLAVSQNGRFALFRQSGKNSLYVEGPKDGSGNTEKKKIEVAGDRWPEILANTSNFAVSNDGATVALVPSDNSYRGIRTGLYLLNTSDGGLRHYLEFPFLTMSRSTTGAPLFSVDSSTLFFTAFKKERVENHAATDFIGVDVATGTIKWEQHSSSTENLLGSPQADQFVTINLNRGSLLWRDLRDGSVLRELELPPELKPQTTQYGWLDGCLKAMNRPDHLLYSPDRRTFAVLSLETGETIAGPYSLDSEAFDLAALRDDRLLLQLNQDHSLVVRDMQNGRRLADLHLYDQDLAWVLTTPDLHYDATPEGQDRLYFQQGANILSLASLFEQTYTPNLLGRLNRDETLPEIALRIVPIPPRVELTVADFKARGLTVEDDTSAIFTEHERVRLCWTAHAGSSSLDDVRIYQNGKALPSSYRGLTVENDLPPSTGVETAREFEILLTPGENHFRAVAVGLNGTESMPSELILHYQPPTGHSSGGIRLHLLIIGVNEYENPRYNLNYAIPDATAFHDRLLAANETLFTEINPIFLTDHEVSRESILSRLREISHVAEPRDVLIFYYAGHGVMSAEAQPQFYLVPPQVTQLYGNDALLAEKAISAADLQQAARLIPAQKQLFILDACQSAGALETVVTMRGAAEEKALASLARSTGTYWLTATGTQQFAAEVESLGHGVFTYALLEALEGSADNGDGLLTVRELDAFLQSRVPELTREHRGSPQYPASYGFGQDFPFALTQP